MEDRGISVLTADYQARATPEAGIIVGYAAIIERYHLRVPLPEILSLISLKHKKYETGPWRVLTPRHTPLDTLMGHLTFAMKYEGVELGILKALFSQISIEEIAKEVSKEPYGVYSRKIWFLFEWLMDRMLPFPDSSIGNYVDLVDSTLQYAFNNPENSKRHRIRNNLPGVRNFCPMIRKTTLLTEYVGLDLSKLAKDLIAKVDPSVKARIKTLSSYQEAKASYDIEGGGEQHTRAERWGQVLRQAENFLVSQKDLVHVQEMLIEHPRFVKIGFREKEGFIGEQDRRHGTLLITHFPAKAKDVDQLMDGLVETAGRLEGDKTFDAVLATTIIAFGFVFIHPFIDGNGRIHRYLFHNVLSRKEFGPKGLIFPISATILDKLDEYQELLQYFSYPRISLIDWKPTSNYHFEINSETIDLYRYFDATRYAEFLYGCVEETLNERFPRELDYLDKFDRMKQYLDDYFEMPDALVSKTIRLLNQGKGRLLSNAKKGELSKLTDMEVRQVEEKYSEIFQDQFS